MTGVNRASDDRRRFAVADACNRLGPVLGITFQHPTFDIDIRRCNNLCEFCFVLQMAPRFRFQIGTRPVERGSRGRQQAVKGRQRGTDGS